MRINSQLKGFIEMNNLRTKIFLGLGFLFVVVLILSIGSIVFINQLANDSRAIIKENYNTIDYSTKMLKALDAMFSAQTKLYTSEKITKFKFDALKDEFFENKTEFEKNLELEKNNITEQGENLYVNELNFEYNNFIKLAQLQFSNKSIEFGEIELRFERIRSTIQSIYNLNMDAVLSKNKIAKNTAVNVTLYMSIIGIVSSLITFIFIIYFPKYIYSPIKELITKLKQISSKEFNQRINFTANDELGELINSFNNMAIKLQEYEKHHYNQLLLEKKRIEGIVHSLQDGVLVMDEANHIIIINKYAQNLLNLDEPSVIGEKTNELVEKYPILKRIIKHIEDNNNSLNPIPFKLENNDITEYIKVESIIITQKNELGILQKIGEVIVLKNITQFEQRNLDKTKLLATVSHELKTPISSLNLSIKLLEDSRIGNMNAEQIKLIDSMKYQTKRLINFVNELLEYAKVETGKIDLHIADIEPYQVIELSVFALLMQINEKKIQIDVEADNFLSKAKADLEKSTWVMVNLLNNAIRYSDVESKIVIKAWEKNRFIHFSVQDFGKGIEPEILERIFDKFTATKNILRKGSGLGLAIAKEFVESQGGTITVESTLGKGTVFTFCLPVYENF